MTRTSTRIGALFLAVVIGLHALLMANAAPSMLSATGRPFMCGTADVCNLHPDQPDEYCTGGPEARCKSCSLENDRCFTERMASNCTSYCRELDKNAVLLVEKGKPCATLSNVTNGYHNATDSPQPGDAVEITCFTGYRVEGSDVIRCLEYGVWSGVLPNCTEIVCKLPVIEHGKVLSEAHFTAVGGSISYKCDTGYWKAAATAICLSDGTWRSATCSDVDVLMAPCHELAWMCAALAIIGLSFILVAIQIYNRLRTGQTCCNNNNGSANKYSATGYHTAQCTDEEHDSMGANAIHADDISNDQTCIMHVNETNCDLGHQMKQQTIQSQPFTKGDILNRETFRIETSSSESTTPKDIHSLDSLPSSDLRASPMRMNMSPSSGGNSPERLSFNLGNLKVNINVNRHGNRNIHAPSRNTPSPQTLHTNNETTEEISDNAPFPTQASDEGVAMADYAHRPSSRSGNYDQSNAKAGHSIEPVAKFARVTQPARLGNSDEPCPRSGSSEEPGARLDNSDEPCPRSGNSDEPVTVGNSDGDEETTTRLSGIQPQPVDDSGPRMLALPSNTVALSDVRRTRRR